MDLPPYQTFFSGQMMKDFWAVTKYFLFYFAPLMMIMFAFAIAGRIAPLIKDAIYPNRRRYHDDEDEDDFY